MKQRMCDFLLQHAGPSIVYRVRREVLGELASPEMELLQTRILSEKDVQYILHNQQPDGWLGTCFHSRMRGAKPLDVSEAALLFLAEKGLDLNHPVFHGAVQSYVTRGKTDPIFDGFEKTYDRYDLTCWGLWLIRAAGIARAGFEDRVDISREVALSLNSFFNVLNYDSVDGVCNVSKSGKRYFQENALWPCNYHLKILAFTQSWRTPEHVQKLAEAVERLLSLSPAATPVYTKVGSYYASPCDAFVQSPITAFDPEQANGAWFHKMELLSRCGIVPYSGRLGQEIASLRKSVDENGICRANMDERYFKNWGAYSGLKLEENWRTAVKRQCDVTFRALMILHYAAS